MRRALFPHPFTTGRLLPGLAVALALVAAGIGPVLPTAAQEAPNADPTAVDETGAAADESQHVVGTDWGPNYTGWNITFYNDTDHDLYLSPTQPTDNVYNAPQKVPAHSQVDSIRGRESIWTGPANMNLEYGCCLDGAYDPSSSLHITSDGSGTVSANCYAQFLSCEVPQAVSNQPIIWKASGHISAGD
jgi:hypothetical protein